MNATGKRLLVAMVCIFGCPWAVLQAAINTEAISNATDVEATRESDGVVRIAWTRNDVPVTVDGGRFPPAAGLGSWAAFAEAEGHVIVMGDTVLFQDEVGPAMDAAFANGLEVTALHNHFFYDEPKIYFMHVGGSGDAVELAQGVRAVWDAVRAVRARSSTPASRFEGEPVVPGRLDAEAIATVVGHPAPVTGDVAKVTIAREGTMHDVPVGGSMGLTTWAAFYGTDQLAAMDGDFIMTAYEVQPVLQALRRSGVHVVALHNHMVGEQPAFYFTHFWGKGKAADLARAFRGALDAQAGATPWGSTD